MNTIWIIDHYSSEPKYGGISRQYDFAVEIAKRGYKVVVIASGFSHFTHSYIAEEECFFSDINQYVHFVYLKTLSYEMNGGLKRARNMFDFIKKVKKFTQAIEDKYGRPDVVEGCSVHPLTWIAAYKISKRYKVRFCAEVRDFWPQIWLLAKEKKAYDPMVVFFSLIEKWAYKKAEKIVCSMYHGDRYICDEKGVDREKVEIIGQPMDCARFDVNAKRVNELPMVIRKFIDGRFICVFSGYFMEYEGVYVMLEAAKLLKDRGIPVCMLFVGSGQEEIGMREYVESNALDNVLIHSRISKELVPALLHSCDVCMGHLEVRGHKEVYKYGVSKNKINEYLYSGAVTLYGFDYEDDIVTNSGGGILFEPYNASDLAEKIERVYVATEADRMQYGIKGREYIINKHDVSILADKLLETLFD